MAMGRLKHCVTVMAACVLTLTACGSNAPKDAAGRGAGNGQNSAPAAGTDATEAAPVQGGEGDATGAVDGTTAPAPGGNESTTPDAPSSAAPGTKPTASTAPRASGANSGAPKNAAGGPLKSGGASAPPGAPVRPQPPGAPAPAPATPTAGPCVPVTLGTWGTTTGPLGALFAAMTPAAKAWVASVNARGGLGGCHQVKLIIGEDGDDPAKAKAVVKKMVEEDGVQAFVAHHGALTLGAVRPYLEEKRVPLFGSSGAYADESQSEMVFLAQPTSLVGESEAYINTVLALNLPNRKIAVFWCAEVPLCSVHNDVIKKQAPTKGFEVVASIRISLFAPDYTSQVLQARQAGADMIILLSDMQTNSRLLRNAKQQNYSPLVVTPGVAYDSQWPAVIGRDGDGVIMTAWSRPWHAGAINREYRESVAKYQAGQPVGNSGSAAWAGMKLLEKAATNLDRDKPASEQLIEGVYKLSNETLGGLVPPATWPKDPSTRAGLHPCTVPVRWTGTEFELPLGEKFVCSTPGPGVKVID